MSKPGFVGFDEQGRFLHYCFCGAWGAFGFGTNRNADPPQLGRWYCGEHKHMGDRNEQPEAGHQRGADPSAENAASRAASQTDATANEGEGGRQAATLQAGEARPIIRLSLKRERFGLMLVRKRRRLTRLAFEGWARPEKHGDGNLGVLAELAAYGWLLRTLGPVSWKLWHTVAELKAISAAIKAGRDYDKIPDLAGLVEVKGSRATGPGRNYLMVACDSEHNKTDPVDHFAYLSLDGASYDMDRRFVILGWLWGHEIRAYGTTPNDVRRSDGTWHTRIGYWAPKKALRDPLSLIQILRDRLAR